MDQLVCGVQLSLRDNAQSRFALCLSIACLHMNHRHPYVLLFQHPLAYLLVFLRDNKKLYLGLPHHHHAVQYKRLKHERQYTVHDLLRVREQSLRSQHGKVHDIHQHGNTEMKIFIQHKSQYVGSSRGRADTDDKPDPDSQKGAPVQRRKHHIVRQVRYPRDCLQNAQACRIEKCAGNRRNDEFFPKSSRPQKKKTCIYYQNNTG